MRLVVFIVSLSIAVGVREATGAAETDNIASSFVVAAVATALAVAVAAPSAFAPLRHVPEAGHCAVARSVLLLRKDERKRYLPISAFQR